MSGARPRRSLCIKEREASHEFQSNARERGTRARRLGTGKRATRGRKVRGGSALVSVDRLLAAIGRDRRLGALHLRSTDRRFVGRHSDDRERRGRVARASHRRRRGTSDRPRRMPWNADRELGELGESRVHRRGVLVRRRHKRALDANVRDSPLRRVARGSRCSLGRRLGRNGDAIPRRWTADVDPGRHSIRDLSSRTGRRDGARGGGAPVSAADIAEATRSVDTVVVQSWLAARGQAFAVDSVGSGAAAPSLARVYAEPSPQPRQEYPPAPSGCDPFGCYEPNVYSSYNGYAYSPYVQRYVYYGSSYYVPYLAPLIVVRGGSRGPSRAHPVGVRPPVVHTPGGTRPAGGRPIVQTPATHVPPAQSPPRGMPSRIRP